jgi:hypothetical protein
VWLEIVPAKPREPGPPRGREGGVKATAESSQVVTAELGQGLCLSGRWSCDGSAPRMSWESPQQVGKMPQGCHLVALEALPDCQIRDQLG